MYTQKFHFTQILKHFIRVILLIATSSPVLRGSLKVHPSRAVWPFWLVKGLNRNQKDPPSRSEGPQWSNTPLFVGMFRRAPAVLGGTSLTFKHLQKGFCLI